MLTIKSLIAGFALSSVFILSAHAVPVTINLAPSTNAYLNSFSYTSTEANLTVTGWSNTVSNTGTVGDIAQTQIGRWQNYGLGVEAANSPHHAVDNGGRDYDGLLFSFDKIVDVSRLGIGWYYTDADVSLLAYTGAAPFGGSLSGSWANLLSNGWSVAGNYNRDGTGGFDVNAGDIKAKYWLVGAYNRAFGGSLSQNNDFIKIKTITIEAFTPPSAPPVRVPESGSLMLLLLGLVGLFFARRRRV